MTSEKTSQDHSHNLIYELDGLARVPQGLEKKECQVGICVGLPRGRHAKGATVSVTSSSGVFETY